MKGSEDLKIQSVVLVAVLIGATGFLVGSGCSNSAEKPAKPAAPDLTVPAPSAAPGGPAMGAGPATGGGEAPHAGAGGGMGGGAAMGGGAMGGGAAMGGAGSPHGGAAAPNPHATETGGTEDPDVVKAVKAAEAAEVALKAKPADAALKQAAAAALADAGDAMMMKSTQASRGKYRGALRYFREALAIDPSNKKALGGRDLIVGIYKQMGLPVP